MIEVHEDIVILHSMAQQVNHISGSFELFETFKAELSGVLKSLFDAHNTVKQELFVVRNNQAELLKKAKQSEVPPTFEKASSRSECLPKEGIAAPPPPSSQSTSPPPPSQSTTPPPTSSPHCTASVPPAPSAPRVPQPPKEKPNSGILYIGDSISSNVDFGALGVATQSEFVKVKAYSSVFDKVSNVAKQAARFPAANFTDVVPAELNKGRFNTLVLQAGSVDITNLNTKDNPKEYMEYFRQETILSAQNIFRAATNALRAHPNLSKVIIMSQIPRYDTPHVDPLALKASLSLLFNTSLTNLWMESPDKEKIHVGSHNIDCNGAIRETRYRHTNQVNLMVFTC